MDMCRDMHLVYYCYFPKPVKLFAIFLLTAIAKRYDPEEDGHCGD